MLPVVDDDTTEETKMKLRWWAKDKPKFKFPLVAYIARSALAIPALSGAHDGYFRVGAW